MLAEIGRASWPVRSGNSLSGDRSGNLKEASVFRAPRQGVRSGIYRPGNGQAGVEIGRAVARSAGRVGGISSRSSLADSASGVEIGRAVAHRSGHHGVRSGLGVEIGRVWLSFDLSECSTNCVIVRAKLMIVRDLLSVIGRSIRLSTAVRTTVIGRDLFVSDRSARATRALFAQWMNALIFRR